MLKPLKIGEVAKLASVGIDTVRYYEKRGILPRVPRRRSGYREFSDASVERIRLAKELQTLGFRLREIVELLRAVDSGHATCGNERRHFESVLARVEARIAELRKVRRSLVGTLRRCDAGACPLLEPAAGRRTQKLGARPSRAKSTPC
jgi:DNA-binding transcriptional MerR regulator